MTELPPLDMDGPWYCELTKERWGWMIRANQGMITIEPPKWARTEKGARRVADRWLRRLNEPPGEKIIVRLPPGA